MDDTKSAVICLSLALPLAIFFFYNNEFLTSLFIIPPLAFRGRNKKGIRALFPGLQKGTCWTKAIAVGEISARLDCGC